MRTRLMVIGVGAMLALAGAPSQAQDTTSAARNAQMIALAERLRATRDIPAGLRVREVVDGGATVVLEDGSVWDVYLPDRPTADAWRVGDYVVVRLRGLMIGAYKHQLINASAEVSGGRATARFAGKRPAEDAAR